MTFAASSTSTSFWSSGRIWSCPAGAPSLGRVVLAAPRHPAVVLNQLQVRVAAVVRNLPEAQNFVLAGGAALIVRGDVNRLTRDLDFFAESAEAVDGVFQHWRKH
jgi:hypothetical protein